MFIIFYVFRFKSFLIVTFPNIINPRHRPIICNFKHTHPRTDTHTHTHPHTRTYTCTHFTCGTLLLGHPARKIWHRGFQFLHRRFNSVCSLTLPRLCVPDSLYPWSISTEKQRLINTGNWLLAILVHGLQNINAYTHTHARTYWQ